MQYWLAKSEPEAFSWEDLVRVGEELWDGVRNYQARNNLAAMQVGDLVLMYHSVRDKQVVGIMQVCREAIPDPTTDDPRWVAPTMKQYQPFVTPVPLAQIKQTPELQQIALIRQSRLSVVPLSEEEFMTILRLGQTSLR